MTSTINSTVNGAISKNKFTTNLMKLLVGVLLVSVQMGMGAMADPIPGDKIFKNWETHSIKFSPNTQYILGLYVNDGKQSLILRDPQKQKSYRVIRFSGDYSSRLNKYFWIDNDSIYINYSVNGEKKGAFVHIEVNGDSFKSTLQSTKASGYIVDALPHLDNKVLFAQNEGRLETDYRLYTVTTKQLEIDDLDDAVSYAQPLDNAIIYFKRHQRLMAVTLDKEKLIFWTIEDKAINWYRLGEILGKDHSFNFVEALPSGQIAVLSNEKTDRKALITFDLNKQTYGEVLFEHPDYDLTDAQLTPDGKNVEYVAYFDHGRMVTKYFSTEDVALEKLVKETFKGKQFNIISQKEGYDNKLVFVFASDDPGQYYLFNKKASKLFVLGKTLPELADYPLAKAEVFTVQTDKDTKVEAFLTKPVANANGVLLVMPHGGPIGVREYDSFDRDVQYLVSRGYSLLKINFRGSSGFGKKFEQSGVGQLGKAIEHDITAVVNDVMGRNDFKQMCSIGISYGGYSAMMLAMMHPERYQCAVAMYGVYDLPYIFNSSNISVTKEEQEAWAKVLGENNDALKAVSPFYMAQKLKVPLLLIAGKDDQIARFEHSYRMKYRLDQLGIEYDHLFYNGVGHSHHTFYGERHQYAYIDDFIRTKLALPALADNEKSSIALGQDALMLADVYESKGLLEQDDDKAFHHYQQAAELGNADGMLMLARFYYHGRVATVDKSKAQSWFEKASKAGSKEASYQLAQLLRDAKLGPANHQASVEAFQLAKKQGHDYAALEVAKAQCLGRGISIDVTACLAELSVKNKSIKWLHKNNQRVMAELLGHKDLSAQARQDIKSLVSNYDSKHNVIFDAQADMVGSGAYSFQGKVRAEFDVPAVIGVYFGAWFKLGGFSRYDDKDQAVYRVKWTTPETFGGKIIGQQTIESLQYTDIMGSRMGITYKLSTQSELVEAPWTMQLYSLDNKLLYEETFHTKHQK